MGAEKKPNIETVYAFCASVHDVFMEMNRMAQVVTIGTGIPQSNWQPDKFDDDSIRSVVRERIGNPEANVQIYREDAWEVPLIPAASSTDLLGEWLKHNMGSISPKIEKVLKKTGIEQNNIDYLWFGNGSSGRLLLGSVVFIVKPDISSTKENFMSKLASLSVAEKICQSGFLLELIIYGLSGLALGTLISVFSGQLSWLVLIPALVMFLLLVFPRLWLWFKTDMRIYLLLATGGTVLIWNLLRDLTLKNVIRRIYTGNTPVTPTFGSKDQKILAVSEQDSTRSRALLIQYYLVVELILIAAVFFRIILNPVPVEKKSLLPAPIETSSANQPTKKVVPAVQSTSVSTMNTLQSQAAPQATAGQPTLMVQTNPPQLIPTPLVPSPVPTAPYNSPKLIWQELTELQDIKNLVLSPDTKRLVILDLYGKMEVRDMTDNRILFKKNQSVYGGCKAAFSPDGKEIALDCMGMRSLLDSQTGEEIHSSENTDEYISSLLINKNLPVVYPKNPKKPISISQQGTVNSDSAKFQTKCGVTEYNNAYDFSADGTYFICTDYDIQKTRIYLYETKTGEELFSADAVLKREPRSVAVTTDGKLVAAMDSDMVVNIYQVDNTEPLYYIRQAGYSNMNVGKVAFSPDGKTLYTGSGRAVSIWKMMN